MTSMYTVCPKCALTLAVTAGDLRVAQGHVRCGRCSHVFNALTRLTSEDRAGGAVATSGQTAPAGGLEDDELIPEAALEFNADASKVFAEPPPVPKWTPTGTYRGLAFRDDNSAGAADGSEPLEIELRDEQLYSATLETPVLRAPEETVIRPALTPRTPARAAPPRPAAPARPAPPARPGTLTSPPVSLEAADTTVPVTAEVWKPRRVRMPVDPGLMDPGGATQELQAPGIVEDIEDTRIARVTPEIVNLSAPAQSDTLRWPWIAGVAGLSVLLLLQVLNHYRNDFATLSSLNRPLTRFYGAFGVHLVPHWDLHAYDVRQLGASGDAARAGQITVRASIKNTARRPQPLPLLRVTLQDRFSNRIAAREVPPEAYMPLPRPALMTPGQRIDVELAFVDPGPNAVGFEIDACLPAPAGGTACQ